MNILDLNHIEAVEGNEVLGGGYKSVYFNKDVNIDFDEKVDIKKNIKSRVDIKGNFAFAEADSDAYGKDTVAEAITYTVTDDYYSGAISNSVAATGPNYYYY